VPAYTYRFDSDSREFEMNRNTHRRRKGVDSAVILEELSTRQFLKPHQSLSDVLTEVAAALGLTLASVRDGAECLELDRSRSVGKLKRIELENLSRRIDRSHRQEFSRTPV
jgi:hypothetical protein